MLRRLHKLAIAGAFLILTVFPSWAQTNEEERRKEIEAVKRALQDLRICPPSQDDKPENVLSAWPDQIENLDSLRIKLSRSTCYGRCPAYTVEIRGNGEVTFVGGLFVAVPGKHMSKISPASVNELYKAFVRVEYLSLAKQYCAEVTDIPTYITSIEYDGRVKTVVHRGGGPAALMDLERKIDEAADTGRWLQPLQSPR